MPASFLMPQSRTTRIVWIVLIFLVLVLFWSRMIVFEFVRGVPLDQLWKEAKAPSSNVVAKPPDVGLVMASTTADDTTWLDGAFPTWKKFVYVTNDSTAQYTVPVNKGREANVYLTFIIDHYDELPDVTIFRHAGRYQWHEDDPLYDGERVLSRLRIPYVQQQGYVNLRCDWVVGCPVEIEPHIEANLSWPANDPNEKLAIAGAFFLEAFEELFPGVYVPESVGSPCCAQFAVTSKMIRARPKSDYERYRHWLTTTYLGGQLSGRIMEYLWHIIFGQPALTCPVTQECYCRLYGICDNVHCAREGECSYYTFPESLILPKGWPQYGWEGEKINLTRIQEEYDELYPNAT